jgi:hypothetical protein
MTKQCAININILNKKALEVCRVKFFKIETIFVRRNEVLFLILGSLYFNSLTQITVVMISRQNVVYCGTNIFGWQ